MRLIKTIEPIKLDNLSDFIKNSLELCKSKKVKYEIEFVGGNKISFELVRGISNGKV